MSRRYGLRDEQWAKIARVGRISKASYTFVMSIFLVHDTAFMHPYAPYSLCNVII